MTSVTFVVQGVSFVLAHEKIPDDCLLAELITVRGPDTKPIEINHATREEFQVVYDYLQLGVQPQSDDYSLFERFSISPFHGYGAASYFARDLHARLRTSLDKKYQLKDYGLRKLNKENTPLHEVDWSRVEITLHKLDYLLCGKVVVVGEALYNTVADFRVKRESATLG